MTSFIQRQLEPIVKQLVDAHKNILLLGARQTGKTTLLSQFPVDLNINLLNPTESFRYEKQPEILLQELMTLKQQKPFSLVIIDEIQKNPSLLDIIQYAIDQKMAQFLLTGSSARKLKHSKTNWLPGRLIHLHLDPLNLEEISSLNIPLDELLSFGSLPGILLEPNKTFRELQLRTYVETYLEQEIRVEAAVRQLNTFMRFIELAASQSGEIINFSKLSQEIGVSSNTITAYYQILEDTLIVERVDAFVESKTRRKLVKAPRYLFFDLGVRRLAAHEAWPPNQTYLGKVFEQFIGLECIRLTRKFLLNYQLLYWRDYDGHEVDWVLKKDDKILPIEVKRTSAPTSADIKSLLYFMELYSVEKGLVVCQTPRKMQLNEKILAIPWQELAEHLVL